jgi:hypothetical protein
VTGPGGPEADPADFRTRVMAMEIRVKIRPRPGSEVGLLHCATPGTFRGVKLATPSRPAPRPLGP